MNAVKYRAWCIPEKQMYDVGTIYFCHGGIKVEGTCVHIGNGWATRATGFDHVCDVVLLQSTGLKDKDGDEIYDDHVLRITTATHPKGKNYQVFWNKTLASWDLMGGGSLLDETVARLMEIVGNIHENPELMK